MEQETELRSYIVIGITEGQGLPAAQIAAKSPKGAAGMAREQGMFDGVERFHVFNAESAVVFSLERVEHVELRRG